MAQPCPHENWGTGCALLSSTPLMKRFTLIALTSLAASCAFGKVVLPGTFSDNMILQQQKDLKLTGQARPLATVTITPGWQKTKITATADKDGRWTATLTTPKGSRKTYTLSFDDGEVTTLQNVAIGEVWFCSGQSNMEMPVEGWGHVKNWEEEKQNAQHPDIRLFQVRQTTAFSPQTNVPLGYTQGWVECSPATVGEFSSLAYFYARELTQKLGVPVGVINSSWGGTPAEAWTSHESLKHVMGYEERLQRIEATGFTEEGIRQLYDAERKEWLQLAEQTDLGLQNDKAWTKADYDDSDWEIMTLPGYWEQSALPAFDGVVWYRRHITLTAEEAQQDIMLNFGLIDDEDVIYWNGQEVAHGSGYNQPRHYSIPASVLREGDNVIVIRVNDTGGEGGVGGTAVEMNINGTRPLAGQWLYRVGCDIRHLPTVPTSPGSSWYPSTLYNAMVHPFIDFPIRGVIWYQGCANVGRAKEYECLFQTLIHDWRRAFGNPTLPFHFVQLANYLAPADVQPDSEWAALREAQRCATQIDGVEMMVNIDLGEANDIHPKNKQEVGRRLAALSLAATYGQQQAGEAPAFSHTTVSGTEMICHFTRSSIAEPLLPDTDVKGFTLQGEDGKWYAAQTRTEGETVIVTAPEVKVPVAVRYGWCDNPTCTLRTKSNFHVSPFRSDK